MSEVVATFNKKCRVQFHQLEHDNLQLYDITNRKVVLSSVKNHLVSMKYVAIDPYRKTWICSGCLDRATKELNALEPKKPGVVEKASTKANIRTSVSTTKLAITGALVA